MIFGVFTVNYRIIVKVKICNKFHVTDSAGEIQFLKYLFALLRKGEEL